MRGLPEFLFKTFTNIVSVTTRCNLPLQLIFFCVLFSNAAFAYTLYGRVSDDSGKPLPFANVYVLGTTKGTTTNQEGRYQLALAEGTYTIVFHYIGFTKKSIAVDIAHADIELNVSLTPEDILLSEVVVSASEDPAYAVIRKAIEKRSSHYAQVQSYQCMAYAKGLQRIVSAPDKIFGQPVNFDGSLDSNNAGILYLSESISELTFKKPDRVSETVISSKVSGDSQGFSWNRAGDFYRFDFYKNLIQPEFLTDRGFISPIADNALLHYRYKLTGVFEDNGRLINKIQVIPKRTNDPVFTGSIYIVEDEWSIHSLDLLLTRDNQMKFLDSLRIRQVNTLVQDSIWMTLSLTLEFSFKILGIHGSGNYALVYRDCEVNVPVSKKDFSNEVLRVDEEANTKDSAYWAANRPVPLTQEEAEDYAKKDSLEQLRNSREFRRKLDKEANQFNAWDLLLGYNYRNSYRKVDVTFAPYLAGVQYNTVEGFNLSLSATIRKELDKKRMLILEPAARYGFSNRHVNGKLRIRYEYKPEKLAYVEAEGGRYVFQFNRNTPISEPINSFYTLLIGRNYMKIFEEGFITFRHRYELVNGLVLRTSLWFAFRWPLENTSSLTVRKAADTEFTANVPEFKQHEAFILAVTLQYRPGQRYLSRPYQKVILGSKYPRISLTYKKSIPGILSSDLNFDFLELELADRVSLGIAGNTTYSVKAGTFINSNTLYLMDYKHFYGNKTWFGIHYREGFQLLDYYASDSTARYFKVSTTRPFVEVHFEHNFDGFLFNKIPGIRKLKLQAVAGIHFLYSADYRDYFEVNAGIENILRILRVDFIFGFSSVHENKWGVRFGIDLQGFNPGQ
ncbi:MAG: membrane protein [Chitinophagales bacterium]|nr:MAG: membrane protein [Chitinophagales bacterium]